MKKKSIFNIIFSNPMQYYDSWDGWEMYGEDKGAYIAMRKEFFVVCTGEDDYQFEYVFNWDGSFKGVREEITIEGIDDNYWIIIDKNRGSSKSILYYKTPNGLKFIHEFSDAMSVFPEDTFKQPGSIRDSEKRFVEWYPKIGGKKAAWFFPDGSMKKGKKKKS